MARYRRKASRKSRSSYSGKTRYSSSRRRSRNPRARTSARTSRGARQQTLRIVIENPGATAPSSIPAALNAIPGTQAVIGKRSRF